MVVGPVSSTPDAIVRWDSNDGTLVADSLVEIDDLGNISINGASFVGELDNEIAAPSTLLISSTNGVTLLATDGADTARIAVDQDQFYMSGLPSVVSQILGNVNGLLIGTTTSQLVGFFGHTPVSRITIGAALTNNVTVGGTNNTIADFTDLTTFANSAAAIRNDIYQLARSMKIVQDGLRTLGLGS